MKRVRKYVYYCDHCPKRMLSGHGIKKHELTCTANPKRECGVCDGNGIHKSMDLIIRSILHKFELREITGKEYDEISKKLNPRFPTKDNPYKYPDSHEVIWIGESITLDQIREIANGCPACMLAVLRQTGLNHHYFHFEFDYKGELAAYMKIKNEEKAAELRRMVGY
jgi:hypothetical protein